MENRKPVNIMLLAMSMGFLCFFGSCVDEEMVGEFPPDTFISIEKIDLTGEDRLNSSVRLSWYGTDKDGYVVGYEFSIDEENWFRTEKRDSVFKFSIAAGQDSADIDFHIRAIDNEGNVDATPAYLRVPLKNSPPVVDFETDSYPTDTTFGVLTFRWNYSDPDGDNTVTNAYLRVNEGTWYEIDRSQPMISLRSDNPQTAGSTNAQVFYQTDLNALPDLIDGWQNDGDNILYLKVVDIAGTESTIDTASVLYNKKQNSDLLLINGQPSNVNQAYREIVNAVYSNGYDAIDFADGNGKNQPVFWNPTFTLLTEMYDKLMFNTDQSLFANPLTGQSAILLEFAAPVMQNFTDGGGKSFVTTSFPPGFDPVDIRGAFPVDSLSQTSGQAVIETDSSIYSDQAGFPSLSPTSLLLGADPFVPTIDAKPIYKAQLKAFGAWKGTDIVGVIREENGNTKQVFFGVELYRFSKDPSALNSLFDKILNEEFNW